MLHCVRSTEKGFALISILLALALLIVVGVTLAAVGVVEYRTSINHRSATRALLLADAGATHALALVRGPLAKYTYSDLLVGSDATAGTDDDGYLFGYPGLAEVDALPDTGVPLGVGRYYVRIVNDDGDKKGGPLVDTNHRLLAICRGETPDNGRAEVRVLLAALGYPAIATNGDLHLPGTPNILGKCGGVHSNQTLYVDGSPTIDHTVTASVDVVANNEIYTSEGEEVIPGYQPPIDIPEPESFNRYCNYTDRLFETEYVLKDGWLVTVELEPDSIDVSGGKAMGWQWNESSDLYTLQGKDAAPGSYCVHGNVQLSGNLGSSASPLSVTIFSTGSVDVDGTPVIESELKEGLLIVAAGDVELGGNTSGGTPQFEGFIYAGAQCGLNGSPVIEGRLLCYDAEDPEGAIDLIDESKINGTPQITYDCKGQRRRTLIESWWEVRAQ